MPPNGLQLRINEMPSSVVARRRQIATHISSQRRHIAPIEKISRWPEN
jgi:hypothetical protein